METRSLRFLLAATALALAACGGGGGGGSSTPAPTTPTDPSVLVDPTVYSTSSGDALPATTAETAATTQHSITLAGAALNYTATTGHLNAGTKASMFYVAYTVANPAANRPIIFFYNGGPGSATVWLHLGSWAPKRIVTNTPGTNIPAPYSLVDNADTLLPLADLVFVDAIGTGYSQALAPNNNRSFWGVDADAAVFKDFILRYTAKTGRTTAPIVIYGESYGGLRSPILAQQLLAAGAPLQAVVLNSAILNYNSNCAVLDPGRLSCGPFIPSYGATAAWHARSTPSATTAELPAFVNAITDYVDAQYAPAAQLFLSSSTAFGSPMTSQLAAWTGMSAATWAGTPLLGPERYRSLFSSTQLIGRYDSRVLAPVGSALASEGDPSSTVLTSAFRSAITDHLRTTLKYQAAVSYAMFNDAAINQWNWTHDGQALPDAIPDLALALTLKPALKVFVIGGYHDLATPFRLTEQDLGRLGSPLPAGVQLKRYVGGHMTYLDDQVRPGLAGDLGNLLRSLP